MPGLPPRETGKEWLTTQSAEIQDEALGPEAGAAYRHGFGVRLQDLAGEKRPERRGATRYTWSLKQARQAAAVKEPREMLPPGGAANGGGDIPAAAGSAGSTRREPVSAAIRLPQTDLGRVVAGSLQVIDSVHDDGSLTPVPVVPGPGSDGVMGAYRSERNATVGRLLPREIEIHQGSPHLFMTVAHEVGHLLDEQIFGAGIANGSEDLGPVGDLDYGEMGRWRMAVLRSKYYRHLMRMYDEGQIDVTLHDDKEIELLVNLEYMEKEMLPLREVWARSYEQYVAVRSGNARMLGELAGARDETDRVVKRYPRHWNDADFEPVAEAIDALLAARGWR